MLAKRVSTCLARLHNDEANVSQKYLLPMVEVSVGIHSNQCFDT